MKYMFMMLLLTTIISAEQLFHQISFEEACEKARNENKVVMIDFYTTWCAPCKKLDQTTWKEQGVIDWANNKVIALKIDAEKVYTLSKKYSIKAYPTILFVQADGIEIGRFIGYRNAENFIEEAKLTIEGKAVEKEQTTTIKNSYYKISNSQLEGLKSKLQSEPNNVDAHYDYAKALFERQEYKEALEQYLWVFDNSLQYKPGYYGVRLSYLLEDITELGKIYPDALSALERRSEKALENIENSMEISRSLDEYTSLSEALNKSSSIIDLYDRSMRNNPSLARQILERADNIFIDHKRYQEVAKLDIIASFEERVKSHEKRELNNDEFMIKIHGKYMITKYALYFEVLLHAGETNRARQLVDKLLAFSSDPETIELLNYHAELANNKDFIKK